MNEIFLCTICNVTNGNCAEDCAYCTQSSHYNTNIVTYKEKSIDKIIDEARIATDSGALGFCLVTSGRGFDLKKGLKDTKLQYIAKAARALKETSMKLHLIACNGRASYEQLCFLKENGIDSYNHNLENAQSFFPKICTTHSWQERYETCENALKAGLGLCCGGIFGLGENKKQRMEFIQSLASLNPHTIPINFYMPNPGLPIKQQKMDRTEALDIIALMRESFPQSRLMIAGGREIVFGNEQKEMFEAGINAIVLGDYLTTKGSSMNDDIAMLKQYGLEIATECH